MAVQPFGINRAQFRPEFEGYSGGAISGLSGKTFYTPSYAKEIDLSVLFLFWKEDTRQRCLCLAAATDRLGHRIACGCQQVKLEEITQSLPQPIPESGGNKQFSH
jgi:hypothetical protein